MLITSKEITAKVNTVLGIINCSPRSIRQGEKNHPFEGLSNSAVYRASKGEQLKLSIRKKFNKCFKAGIKLTPCWTQKEVHEAVKQYVDSRGLKAWKIKNGMLDNPFDGYVGRKNFYFTYLGYKQTKPARAGFEAFFEKIKGKKEIKIFK